MNANSIQMAYMTKETLEYYAEAIHLHNLDLTVSNALIGAWLKANDTDTISMPAMKKIVISMIQESHN